jgi:hypothetical protein
MIVTKNEDTTYFDVDGTLVLPSDAKHGQLIKVLDPVTGRHVLQRIHAPMVRLLKEADRRGSHVVVWSRGGWEWARNVVIALGLESYVDEVKCKPLVYFDDVSVDKWLPYRVFLDPSVNYKKDIKP